MNPFKKAYCRAFQFSLKLVGYFLPFKDPIVSKSFSDIPGILKKNSKCRPLVVTGPNLYKRGIVKLVTDELDKANIDYAIYYDTVANPTTNNVEDAYKVFVDNNCDSIIAFGGGSPMDCAKVVGAKAARPKKNVTKFAGVMHVRKKIPLLIAIPTTAGTGSETTLAAVIVDSETRHKYAVSDFPLIPSYAILDSKALLSLPQNVISTTGMDALTHAIESYLGNNGTSKTKKNALESAKIIFNTLEVAYLNRDEKSLNDMLYASFLAGKSFTRAYVGYVHALAHALGGKYDIGHGLANAIILPIVLKEYGKSIYKKMYKLGLYTGISNKEDSKKEACEKVIAKIEAMNKAFGISNHIDCIINDDIPGLAKTADHEANPLYPVPVLWDKKKLEKMYKIIGDIK